MVHNLDGMSTRLDYMQLSLTRVGDFELPVLPDIGDIEVPEFPIK